MIFLETYPVNTGDAAYAETDWVATVSSIPIPSSNYNGTFYFIQGSAPNAYLELDKINFKIV